MGLPKMGLEMFQFQFLRMTKTDPLTIFQTVWLTVSTTSKEGNVLKATGLEVPDFNYCNDTRDMELTQGEKVNKKGGF